jgi:dTDP-4-dehydrorhamnose reductase
MSTTWITGANGLIGNYLVQAAPASNATDRIVGLTRNEVDLTDFAAVRNIFRDQPPQFIIHCAAMSQSPACQANPALARKINIEATALLAEIAAEIPFVFFSTDLVFDGRAGNYDESAAVNPLSIYSETKVAAEKIVLANPRHTVIRTSLNGGTSPGVSRCFNHELRNAWKEGRVLRLFNDEFRSPIPAEVTAKAVWQLVAHNKPGLYHLAGSERLSRWQIGTLLAARWPQLHPKIEATSRKEYSGAPRPPDTSLNCSKIQKLLSFSLPGLSQWLNAHPDKVF